MLRYRSLRVLTEPTVEPVTLAEAKQHCRVDTDTDDAYLAALISAARQFCASYMDETFLPTQYVMRLDRFPLEITLPRPPMVSSGSATVVSITYTLNDRTTATLDTSTYRVDRDSVPGAIRPLYNETWPTHLHDTGSISVTWWGGRATVPQRVRSAMLMLIGMWYERRMAADSAGASEVPFGVRDLLDSTKWGAYH